MFTMYANETEDAIGRNSTVFLQIFSLENGIATTLPVSMTGAFSTSVNTLSKLIPEVAGSSMDDEDDNDDDVSAEDDEEEDDEEGSERESSSRVDASGASNGVVVARLGHVTASCARGESSSREDRREEG